MHPAQESGVSYVHGHALELLAQQQQQPQQQLALSGEARASFEVAGPLPPLSRDVCRKAEQEIDQEIEQLLAMKQQLRHRQQHEQQQAQQQMQQGGAAATSFQLDWSPLMDGTTLFGGNTQSTTSRHTIDLGSLSAMSLQETLRSSQGLNTVVTSRLLNNNTDVMADSSQGADVQFSQGQLHGLTQTAPAARPGSLTLSAPQMPSPSTGLFQGAADDDNTLAARAFLQQQLLELQQQEQLLQQQELKLKLKLQLQLQQGNTLPAAALTDVLYDSSFDGAVAGSSGVADCSPVLLPIAQGWSSPLLSQQMLQQQEMAMQSQLYAPASGQIMLQQQQQQLLMPEAQNTPGCAFGSSNRPVYQQQLQQQQALGLPAGVASPGQPGSWTAAATSATSLEGSLLPGALVYATVSSPVNQQLQRYQQQQQQLGHAHDALLQMSPSSGPGSAAAAAARGPFSAQAGSSWPQAAGATPANAQAASAAAAAASLAGVAGDTVRMQAAYDCRHAVDLAAAVAAGPMTFSAQPPHLQAGSFSTQQQDGAVLSGCAREGVQCSNQTNSRSFESYMARTGPAAYGAAAGQGLVNAGQTQVNTGQAMASSGAPIPCTPQQLARFVNEQHYHYQRASFDVSLAPHHRAVMGGHTCAQGRRRRSAGPVPNWRRASFDSASYSSGSSMGLARGSAAGAAAERDRSSGRAAAANAAAAAATTGPPAGRASLGVWPVARPALPAGDAAGNASRQQPEPHSPAAGAAAGQAQQASSTISHTSACPSPGLAGDQHAGGSSSSQQLARAAAPKWAGSFWHPLAPLATAGRTAGSKGTGVFMPGGTEHLL